MSMPYYGIGLAKFKNKSVEELYEEIDAIAKRPEVFPGSKYHNFLDMVELASLISEKEYQAQNKFTETLLSKEECLAIWNAKYLTK